MTGDDTGLGDHLVRAGKLDAPSLARARALCEDGSRRFASVLLHLGLVREDELAAAFAACLGIPVARPETFPGTPVAASRLRGPFLKKAALLPLEESADGLCIAMADPADAQSLRAVQLAVDKPVEVSVAERTLIDRAIDDLYFDDEPDPSGFDDRHDADLAEDIERLKGLASEAPVIRAVNGLIDRAVDMRASDIHIEPSERRLGVRFRLDGRLAEQGDLPIEQAAAIVSRVKIMAKLDIAERRLPQDGRVETAVRGRTVDLRISTMPTVRGESIVIRILDRESVKLEFESLGIGPENRKVLRGMLQRPNGIVLVTGPTGSGKTTTLYAALTSLRSPDVNIMTVEDPVEYQLAGIKQIQTKPSIGLDFAHVLRSILRHDPDIVLVGEIRDRETADIAIQAAFTGHLVLSTLHTNDAAGSITRLLDMGLENYLLTSSIVGVVAQRLVRRLCPQCRQATPMEPTLAARLDLDMDGPVRAFRAAGCDSCGRSGYRGRTPIMEAMPMSEPVRDAILTGVDATELHRIARRAGMRTLMEDGLAKVLAGETSLDEVLRVTRDADHGDAGRRETRA